ncbi:MAG: type 4a pilus biogenesis protein PilO [Pyrinomonadaceae bacterium]|nr:type 4a pilus biogenesis protein PilO [Acidobacteriota bacterium]MBK7933651.1 type 4a pilus biogenesis protein PilO [Acidobacteriota bacterium]MBP7376729.1 type 4a pilus biogenesis protein PilO [Pyrinomonadaceae bacterium]
MLEKIKNLKWHFQLMILVGVASLIYASVWYFVTSETRAEITTLTDQVAQLQQKNETARLATQRINEFRSLYASKAAEYEELKVLLPEQRELTNVLQGLQDTANDARLIVMRFSPRDETQQDMIMAKPVEVEVDSNFNNLRAFFDSMAKLPRIVSITDFKINQLEKQSENKTLHAQFLLTAYYAAPTDLNSAAAPGAPGAAPVPGTAPAPGTVPAPAAAPAK